MALSLIIACNVSAVGVKACPVYFLYRKIQMVLPCLSIGMFIRALIYDGSFD